jgi:uncharacterized protein (TIGR03083 family)
VDQNVKSRGELAELDPFELFDAEAERLDRFFGSLDEAGWLVGSACQGWSVRDVLGHLAGEEEYNHACLDGTVGQLFARLEREGAGGDLNSVNEWYVRQRRSRPAAEVLAEWREANGSTRRRMRERGRDGIVQTVAGPYPAGLQTFHYASELATHADDVGAPVAGAEEPGRTGWRATVGRFVLAEQDRPVAVTPTTPQGFEVRVDSTTGRLPPDEFVAATVARLPDDHPLDPRLRDALACLA